jgi:hypothetical protein
MMISLTGPEDGGIGAVLMLILWVVVDFLRGKFGPKQS